MKIQTFALSDKYIKHISKTTVLDLIEFIGKLHDFPIKLAKAYLMRAKTSKKILSRPTYASFDKTKFANLLYV